LVKIPTPEEQAQRRLAVILEGYLSGEKWASEKTLQRELDKSGPAGLKELLDSERFSYLKSINPQKLEHLRRRFL
jgi:hypothetical protein